MTRIQIGTRTVALNERPYFIADLAANHDGDLDRALRLIELAKESGADAVKFQNFKAEKIVSDFGFTALKGNLTHQKNWAKSVFEVYQDASLDDNWTPVLKRKCEEIDIEYMTSPYDFGSVDWADRFVNCFKIGSACDQRLAAVDKSSVRSAAHRNADAAWRRILRAHGIKQIILIVIFEDSWCPQFVGRRTIFFNP